MALDFGKRLIKFPGRGFVEETSDHYYVIYTHFKSHSSGRFTNLGKGISLMVDDSMYSLYEDEFNFTCKMPDGEEVRICGPAVFYTEEGLTDESIKDILRSFSNYEEYFDATKLKSE
ncbi:MULTISPECIES: hypothetical protein [Bacillus cereus group]|uniref:hypothetical protein n=1 Tax=Bacillus cereus group TaxID=86661 RepID=UPI0021D130D6|nr:MULTISPECIES: hypothetical protein [Bacillus cereus group]MCU5201673.1 hypothetical protein [Bacillus paranthracis]MCU5374701.1 hypothetical protein [Bacillus pacificus]